MGFPGGSEGEEFPCNVGDLDLIPGLGRSPRGEHGNPLQYSCLESPHGQRSLIGYSPWNSPGQNTGVGSLSLLQGIFPTQESNPGLEHCRGILYQVSHKGSFQKDCANFCCRQRCKRVPAMVDSEQGKRIMLWTISIPTTDFIFLLG